MISFVAAPTAPLTCAATMPVVMARPAAVSASVGHGYPASSVHSTVDCQAADKRTVGVRGRRCFFSWTAKPFRSLDWPAM